MMACIGRNQLPIFKLTKYKTFVFDEVCILFHLIKDKDIYHFVFTYFRITLYISTNIFKLPEHKAVAHDSVFISF